MFIITLVPTCQNTQYHNLQVNCVKLKSHIFLNGVTAAVCTFCTELNFCLFRIDFFVGERKKLQWQSSGKAQTATHGKEGIGYYTLTVVA